MLGCLSCYHGKLHEPPDWKPVYQGQELEEYHVREHIRRTGMAQRVTCTLAPQWMEFNTNHYCGQWTGRTRALLPELAASRDISDQWYRRAMAAEEETKALKAELKIARERSAKRLAKLRLARAPA